MRFLAFLQFILTLSTKIKFLKYKENIRFWHRSDFQINFYSMP